MIQQIKNEYFRRRSVNYQYSLRAFANHAGISPGAMSELLRGKRPLSEKLQHRIATNLGLQQNSLPARPESNYETLKEDEFALIADWYYFAILSLMKIRGFCSDTGWIARRLGISELEASQAIERLERLKIIERRDGRLVRIKKRIETTTDIPSAALRESHRQTLALAEASLFRDPIETRDITGATLAIPLRKLSEAKKVIQQFRERFVEDLESSDSNAVYNLCIQLYPLTREP